MFNQAEKDEIEALLGCAFDTYKEQIAIYKTPVAAYISTGPNFNFAFAEQQPSVATQYVTNSGVFWATVEYNADQRHQELVFSTPGGNVFQAEGDVRLSVSGSEARSFLRDCEKVVLDGQSFKIVSDIVSRGMFTRDKYDCWLKKIDNGKV